MNEVTVKTIETMQAHGGRFIKTLAALWNVADPLNRQRVERAFRLEFTRYNKIAELVQSNQTDSPS